MCICTGVEEKIHDMVDNFEYLGGQIGKYEKEGKTKKNMIRLHPQKHKGNKLARTHCYNKENFKEKSGGRKALPF